MFIEILSEIKLRKKSEIICRFFFRVFTIIFEVLLINEHLVIINKLKIVSWKPRNLI